MEKKGGPLLPDAVVYCTVCANERTHSFTFTDATSWEIEDQCISGGTILYRGYCQCCNSNSVYLERSYDSESFDVETDSNGEYYLTSYAEKFFHSGPPPCLEGNFNFAANDRDDIPQNILSIVDETQQARLAGSWRLWGTGVRMVLEASLGSLGVSKKNPKNKNEDLCSQINNYINSLSTEDRTLFADFLVVLHDLRLFGNDSVHHNDVVPAEFRDTLAKFVVAMLQFMFVMPAQRTRIAKQFTKMHPKNV